MLVLQNLTYIHPNKEVLFKELYLSVKHGDRVALVGNNGAGKSTLLKLIADELKPRDGQILRYTLPYYIPQLLTQFDDHTIAQALGIDTKLNALNDILKGNVTEEGMSLLNDDWAIEERSLEALKKWKLDHLSLLQKMYTLSGGEKTKVFLAGIAIHKPEFILMDEPSNHLDVAGRQLLYEFIQTTKATLIVVSHDRVLLNLLQPVLEISRQNITAFGGNYDFYTEQKQLASNAIHQDVQNAEKTLRKAKEKQRESIERQQKLNARGKDKQGKEGVARIMMNTLRNKAEKSTSKLKSAHADKIGYLSTELQELRADLPDLDKMKLGFDNSDLHKGKILFKANGINILYSSIFLWSEDISFEIRSGERIALQGLNGSGKTTLIKLILGETEESKGSIYRTENHSIYIDQNYSLINNSMSVYEQAQSFNVTFLQEHEVKIRLSRFLFTKNDWDKSCSVLSGGERMRLILSCLTVQNKTPDIIILDEPTNNLDLQNIEILTAAIKEYQGTLIVVSHDKAFLEELRIERSINLI